MKTKRDVGMRKVLMVLLSGILLLSASCTSVYPNRDPRNESFPVVRASSLDGRDVRLPDVVTGEPALIVIGYLQESQFDIDRWFLGLAQLKTPIAGIEVPAVRGFIPGMLQSTINRGMKEGIPKEDWKAVYTVYEDADILAKFTGTERARNARVLLLDAEGVVRWFSDRGYNTAQVQALDDLVRTIVNTSESIKEGESQ